MSENSSQAVNSSGQGLFALQNSLRVAITTTVVQLLVWPFINLFMIFVFRQREALRSELPAPAPHCVRKGFKGCNITKTLGRKLSKSKIIIKTLNVMGGLSAWIRR